MSINNEEYFAVCTITLLSHEKKEFLTHFRLEPLLKEYDVKTTLIGDRRNHIAAKASPCSGYHQTLTTTATGAPYRVIGTQTHLIAPVNLALFLLRLYAYTMAVLIQLMANRGRVLLGCTTQRLLRGEPPARRILPYDSHLLLSPITEIVIPKSNDRRKHDYQA